MMSGMYLMYLPGVMLNVTAIFMFSTVMLFNVSGNDMIKIQEESVDEALADFRLLIGLVNFDLTKEIKEYVSRKVSGGNNNNRDERSEQKNRRALWIATVVSALLLVLTSIAFLLYGKDLTPAMILYNIVIIASLFVTEVYVYFEIVRMYRYRVKQRFYDQLFKKLLRGGDVEDLKTYVCDSKRPINHLVHEENAVFH